MVFIYIIVGAVFGFFFKQELGILLGAILGALVFLTYQLEVITDRLPKKKNSSDEEPDV